MDKWYIKMSNIIHIVKFTGPILEDLARIATLVFDQVIMEEERRGTSHVYCFTFNQMQKRDSLLCMVVIVFVIVSLQSIVSKRIHRTNGVVHNGGRCTAMRPDFVPPINCCRIFYFYCIIMSIIYHHKYSINTIINQYCHSNVIIIIQYHHHIHHRHHYHMSRKQIQYKSVDVDLNI